MRPHTLDTFEDRYNSISFERNDEGILLVTLHAMGDPTTTLH